MLASSWNFSGTVVTSGAGLASEVATFDPCRQTSMTYKKDVAVIMKDVAEIKELLSRRPWFRFECFAAIVLPPAFRPWDLNPQLLKHQYQLMNCTISLPVF